MPYRPMKIVSAFVSLLLYIEDNQCGIYDFYKKRCRRGSMQGCIVKQLEITTLIKELIQTLRRFFLCNFKLIFKNKQTYLFYCMCNLKAKLVQNAYRNLYIFNTPGVAMLFYNHFTYFNCQTASDNYIVTLFFLGKHNNATS